MVHCVHVVQFDGGDVKWALRSNNMRLQVCDGRRAFSATLLISMHRVWGRETHRISVRIDDASCVDSIRWCACVL